MVKYLLHKKPVIPGKTCGVFQTSQDWNISCSRSVCVLFTVIRMTSCLFLDLLPGGGLCIKLLCNPVFFISRTCLSCQDRTLYERPPFPLCLHILLVSDVHVHQPVYTPERPLYNQFMGFQTSRSFSAAVTRLNTDLKKFFFLSFFFIVYPSPPSPASRTAHV